ncbi:MAG TPA: efflux RND transporter periplasmic adaptor subunit, partial [Candidatus Gracilibacteria bacterium]|nr:efflux RND transporter periplasmic adaptor subunit [Candidatus Gracilibacteria bacterium]
TSAQALLKKTEEATSKTLQVLNNSTAGNNFSQANLSGYINAVNSQLASLRNSISSLNSADSSLKQIIAANATNLNSAERAVESAKKALATAEQGGQSGQKSQAIISAEAQYQSTLAQLKLAEENAEKSVKQAESAYESARKSSELSVMGARTNVISAGGSREQASVNLSKLSIKAPFSGKITNLPVKVGDEVNPGTILISLNNDQALKVVCFLSSEEVRQVKSGDLVTLNNKHYPISSIAPSADPINKKYRVEIMNPENVGIGEFVKISFNLGQTDLNDKRIYLPITAINLSPNENFVWIIKDQKAQKQKVALGEINGKYVEIISGLKIDDPVIIEGGRILDINQNEHQIKILNPENPQTTSQS